MENDEKKLKEDPEISGGAAGFCPNCGARGASGNFCYRCGAPLYVQSDNQSNAQYDDIDDRQGMPYPNQNKKKSNRRPTNLKNSVNYRGGYDDTYDY